MSHNIASTYHPVCNIYICNLELPDFSNQNGLEARSGSFLSHFSPNFHPEDSYPTGTNALILWYAKSMSDRAKSPGYQARMGIKPVK